MSCIAVLATSPTRQRGRLVTRPQERPLYLDLPFKDGVPQQDVLARWTDNAPLAFIDQCIDHLRRYAAISIDVSDKDGFRRDTNKLHEVLDKYGISNSTTSIKIGGV